jgi:hypothetical protein
MIRTVENAETNDTNAPIARTGRLDHACGDPSTG